MCKVNPDAHDAVEIHYEDHGSGKPIVLIHGWPLSGRSIRFTQRHTGLHTAFSYTDFRADLAKFKLRRWWRFWLVDIRG